jgi:hypothetical protein
VRSLGIEPRTRGCGEGSKTSAVRVVFGRSTHRDICIVSTRATDLTEKVSGKGRNGTRSSKIRRSINLAREREEEEVPGAHRGGAGDGRQNGDEVQDDEGSMQTRWLQVQYVHRMTARGDGLRRKLRLAPAVLGTRSWRQRGEGTVGSSSMSLARPEMD